MKNRSIITSALLLLFVFAADAKAQNPHDGKKNQRPAEHTIETESQTVDKNRQPAKYFYEFTQPNFVVSHIRIEHDENGKGTITIGKKDFEEEYTDPIQISEATLERLDAVREKLNFLESDENYQSEKYDYGHLGNMTFTMKQAGRERTAKFNWSDNADAQALAREYKKITNQFVWIFDITVSSENQPLESPRIMKSLEGMIKRGDIADPVQMLPFLKQLSQNERVPLITRNHALRIIKEIDK